MKNELNKPEQDLLRISTLDLLNQLSENPELIHVKQMAFDYYHTETKEEYQVQVIVTRDRNDFLGPFQTEMMNAYKPNSK